MSGTSKLIGYIIVGALLAIGVNLFLVQPILSRVANLSAEERATRSEINRLEQQILAYKTAQSDLSRATGKSLLFSTFVTDKKLYLPIEEMEAGAKKTGTGYDLQILRDFLIEPAAPAAKKGAKSIRVTAPSILEEIPYTLSVTNPSYVDIINFLQYLEHLPHYTEVSKIDVLYLTNSEIQRTEMNVTINGVFLATKEDEVKP